MVEQSGYYINAYAMGFPDLRLKMKYMYSHQVGGGDGWNSGQISAKNVKNVSIVCIFRKWCLYLQYERVLFLKL